MCDILTTRKEACKTAEKPTERKQKATPEPYRPVTPVSELRTVDADNTEGVEYVNCFLQWLGLNCDWKRMLDDEMNMMVHKERIMENITV
jgi:hypothetical protein